MDTDCSGRVRKGVNVPPERIVVFETWKKYHDVDTAGYLDRETFMSLILGMPVKQGQ